MKLTADQLKTAKEKMLTANYEYKQSNGVHNFLNVAIQEGIELKTDCTVNPFWVDIDDTRVYGLDPVGNETRDAVLILEKIFEEQTQEPLEPTAKEPQPQKQEIIPAGQLYGIVPEYLTDALIKNHPGTIPCLISMQKTNPAMIKEMTDASGKPVKVRGKIMKYVDTAYMTVALNYATLMNWNFEVLETRDDMIEKEKHVSVLGCLTIITTEGHTIQKQQWGSQVLKAKMELGDAFKAAASDSMKKCASMLGIAADVYAGAV